MSHMNKESSYTATVGSKEPRYTDHHLTQRRLKEPFGGIGSDLKMQVGEKHTLRQGESRKTLMEKNSSTLRECEKSRTANLREKDDGL